MKTKPSARLSARALLLHVIRVVALCGVLTGVARAQTFQINSLTPNNPVVVDVNGTAGDDRGGIAVSGSQVFYSGDAASVRASRNGLTGVTTLGVVREGFVTDLRTETVYLLANGTTPITPHTSGATITTLLALDGLTGATNGTVITLSSSIAVPSASGNGSVGVFAGWGRIAIHNGTRVYSIAIPTGVVTDLGAQTVPTRAGSETWAYWGVAEFIGGETYLAYVQDSTKVVRRRVSNGAITTIATFSNLGDMASFTVVPALNRWYFHYENGGQFGAVAELLGYADATFTLPNEAPTISSQPAGQLIVNTEAAAFSVSAIGTDPLRYQWRKDGMAIANATNTTFSLPSALVSDSGGYTVVITNNYGAVTSSVAVLTVEPITTDLLKITSLRTNNFFVVDPLNYAGDDRGGLVVTDQKIFLRGDDSVGSFNVTNLGSGVRLGTNNGANTNFFFYDSMIGDLRSRKVYLLANGSTAIGVHGGTATTLIEIHGSNGVPVGSPISLSASIGLPDGQNAGGQYSGKVGLFSGWGRLVIHNGTNAFSIDPTTGTVTDFGAMTTPVRSLPQPAESWAYWGVAEYYGGTVKLVYGRDATSIVRSTVPSGTVEVIGTFSNLHDLANLTVVPSMNRWYFHNESVNQFTNYGNYGAEVLGYADATFLFQSQSAITFAANPVTVLEDSGASATSSFVTLIPGGTTSFVVTNDNNTLFSVQPALSAVGTLTFTPGANANGTAVLGVTALNSSSVQVGTGTFTITVTPVNDAPTVTLASGSVTVNEDSGAQTSAAFATTSAGPANEAGQVVTLTTVTNNNNALFSAQPAISAAGTLTFTAAANAFGSAIVTVIGQDNGGTLNGGVDTSAPQFFTITVTPVNDAPSVSFASNVVVLEDSGSASLASFAGFSPGPANESGQTLVGYTVANNNNGLFSSQPAINNSGVLAFTPAANANGVATVTVIAQDDGGTANGGVDKTTNTFTLTVTAVNDAPGFALGFYTGLSTNSFVTAWGALDHGASTVPPGVADVTAVASGTSHSLALKRDGTVVAWGDAPMSTVPVGLSGVTAIASGWNHSLALKSDGTVVAWGGNSEGQSTVPPGLDHVVAIAGGFNVSMAAKSDGTVVVWGQADFGQLTIPGGLANVIAVAAGYHSVALKSDGTVVVWGGADEGELNMPSGLSGVTAIAAGNNHTVALKGDGTVVAWGNNSQGQTNVPVGLTDVIAIAAGSHNSLALKSDGTVVAWGRNNAGQSDVPVGLVNVTGIAGGVGQGNGHSLAIVATFSTNGIAVNEDSGAFTLALAVTNIVAGPADESGQAVNFIVTNNNNGLFISQPVISAAGTLTFTSKANCNGTATVTVIAHDNGGTANGGVDTSAAQTFIITVNSVNDAPSVGYASNVVVLEESGAFISGAGFATFSPGPANESAQTLVAYTVSNSNEGLFTSQPALAADGTLTFALATATNGVATVTVIAQDSGGTANGGVDSVTNTFTITVAGVNHAPSFALAAATVTVLEDAGAQSAASFGTSILAGPANEAAQVVSFVVTNDNNALFLVQPALSGAGTLSFTPAVNAYGSATVTVIAHDDGGTANGGVDTSAAQFFTITVTAVNDAPTIGFASNVVVLEDGGAASLSGFAAIATGPANESGQMFLGLTVGNDNPSLFSVAPALSGGTLTFTPAANSYGSATVTVIAQDDGGTANGGVDKATNTFTITVTAVNDAPIITFASNVVVQQDSGPASLSTFASITTGPASESGQSITNLTVSNDNNALFSAQPSLSGGTLTFTPALNAIGSATVTVIAQDNGGTANGGVNAATNTFTISVIGVNHAPTFTLRPVNTQSSLLNNGSFETGSFSGWIATDTANTLPTLAVRANGTNLGFFNVSSSDGTYSATHGFSGANAGSISLAQDVTLPPGGGAALAFTYRAAWQTFGAAGDRVFRFAVQPAGGGADLYSQTILTVSPNAFGFQTTNMPVLVDLSSFAGQSIRVVFVTDIAAGDAGNGSFQLDNVQLSATTPDFTVYESTGASTTLNFATNILAGPPSELAQTVTFTVTNNNNALFSSQPAIAVDGTLTFAPKFDSNGVATVTVYAHDNGGTANGGVDTSVAHTFTITVLPINSAPQISFNTANLVVNEDRAPYSAALATFSRGPADEAGQSITNVVTSNNNAGLFSVQPSVSTSGVLTFTPAANSNGVATVTVIAQDNGGTANGGVNLTTNSFTLTVTAVNDAPSFALPAGPLGPPGVVWTARDSNRNWMFMASSADGTKLAAVVDGGQIYTSSDSGATWTARDITRSWAEITMSADGTKLAATVSFGQIYTSSDSGVTWTPRDSARGWRDITMSADGTKLAALDNYGGGSGGRIYTSSDSGVTWTPRDSNRSWTGITMTPDGTILVATHEQGMIYRSSDSGATWTALSNAGSRNWRRVCTSADGTKLVATTYGDYAYASGDSGATWAPLTSLGTAVRYDIACSSDGTKLVTGTMGGRIHTSTDSGATWTAQDVNRSWLGMAMSADGTKLAATVQGGQIYTSVGVPGSYVLDVLEDSGAYTGGANLATSISPGPADEAMQLVDFLVSNNNSVLFSVQPAVDGSGTLVFTPAANAFGTATVTIRAHDNGGTANGGVDTSAAQTFTINVTNVNDAPSITLGSSVVTVLEDSGAYSGALATFSKGPANESGQAITNVAVTANNNTALFSVQPAVSTSGVLTFTPAANANGSATVTITAQDNGGTANGGVDTSASQTFTINVTNVNDAPSFVLSTTPIATSWWKADGNANDSSGANHGALVNGVTYAAGKVGQAFSFDGSLKYVRVPDAANLNFGTTTDFTLEAWIKLNGAQNGLVGLLAKGSGAPFYQLMVNGNHLYAEVFSAAGFVPLAGTTTALDDGNFHHVALVVSRSGQNGKLYVDGNQEVSVNNSFLAGGLDITGDFLIGVRRGGDGPFNGLIDETTVHRRALTQAELQAIYNAGSAGKAGSVAVLENSGAFTANAFATGISAGPADEAMQLLDFLVTNDNNALFSSQPAIATDGTLTFTPAVNTFGTATVTVRLHDNGGTLNGGVDTSAAQTFTINVTNVNVAPTVAFSANNVLVLEDAGLVTSNGFATVTSYGPGETGQTLVGHVVTSDNSGLFSVQPAISASGVLTFTPAVNANGVATVTVVSQDSGGTANGGVDKTTNTFTITVGAVNDAPSFALGAGPSVPGGSAVVSTFVGSAGAGRADGTGTAAGFNGPEGMRTDAAGNLYVTDFYNNTIRKVTPAGVVTTLAGSATAAAGYVDATGSAARFNGPQGIAVNAAGDTIYVVEAVNYAIRKISFNGSDWDVSTIAGVYNQSGSADGTGSDARFGNGYMRGPVDVVLDSAGNLFVADGWNQAIRKVTPAGVVTTFAGSPGHGGEFADGTGTAARLGLVSGIAVDSADNLYAAEFTAIRKITPAGEVTTLAGGPAGANFGYADGNGAAAKFSAAWGIGLDGAGNVYVAEENNRTVRKITPTGDVTTVAGLAGSSTVPLDGASDVARFSLPVGLTVDAAGNIYVSDNGNNSAIRKIGQGTVAGPFAVTVLEDAGDQTVSGAVINVSAGPADESGQVVSFVVTNDNNALFSSQPAIAADGTLTFTPAANAFGSATVTVIAQDDGGTANGGVDTSAAQTFTLTVTPVNDAPTFSLAGTNVSAFTADGAVTQANWLTNLRAGPANESGQTVTLTVTNSDNAQFTVQPAIAADGTLTFTPVLAASGIVTVGVIAQDNGGTANGGVDTSVVHYFTISFANVKVFVSDSPTVAAGDSVSVPVSLAGLGVEGGVGFTLTFDPTLLSFNSVSAPAGVSLLAQASQAGSGRVGIAVSKPVGSTFAAGTNLVITVSFTTAAIMTNAVTPVGYSDAIAVQQVADGSAGILTPVLWVPGQVNIMAGTAGTGTLEGDVSPRPGGNGNVTVADAIQIGRYAAGLDTITGFGPNSEFQRADCAPLGTKGDGAVTVADWVQALRFAAGMDTPGIAGGPTGDGPLLLGLRATSLKLPAGSRTVRVVSGSLVAGRENTVIVQMDAQGNEAGVQLSLGFDATALTFVRATVGSGAVGGSLMTNTTKVAAGKLGLVLVLPAGRSVAAGTQDLISLTFNVIGSGSTAINVATSDTPVVREVADVNAVAVGAGYVDGAFNIVLPVGLKAAGMERAQDGSLRLVVRNSDGTAVTTAQAAKYQVYVTANLGGAWTLLPNALVVESGALKIVDPAASGAGLRLYKLVETP